MILDWQSVNDPSVHLSFAVPDCDPGPILGRGSNAVQSGRTARRAPYMRKTPNWPRSMGALRAAEMASASTVRVWGGSITPSSHSLAEP